MNTNQNNNMKATNTNGTAAGGERLLTLQHIRERGSVSRPTVYRWTHERGLKTIRVGGCVRVRESDWLAWIAQHASGNNAMSEGGAQ